MYIILIINTFIEIYETFFTNISSFYIYKCVLVYNNLSVIGL